MTFHLEGPWLSTTGKKKGPKKWASAEHKHRAEERSRSWNEFLKTQGVDPNQQYKNKSSKSNAILLSSGPRVPPGRETVYIPSKDTGAVPCTKKDTQSYTGSAVVGIVVQHKSCLQPVFSQEAAMDSAKMRR
jgi:hypothetical protein